MSEPSDKKMSLWRLQPVEELLVNATSCQTVNGSILVTTSGFGKFKPPPLIALKAAADRYQEFLGIPVALK